MVRYVHQELWAAVAVLAGLAVGAAVAGGTGQRPPVRGDAVGEVVVFAFLFLALVTLVRASRLKWVSEVREFDAATPLTDDDRAPRRNPVNPRLLALVLWPALGLYFFADTGASVVPLVMGLDWLGKAAVTARWERRHCRHLWRDPSADEPLRLRYTVLSPNPGTRTATDAPPA